MNKRIIFAAAALAALGAGQAAAATPSEVLEQMSKCSEIRDNAQRLTCYDALAPQLRETAAATKKPAERTEAEKESLFGWDLGGIFGSSEPETTPEKFGQNQLPRPEPTEDEVVNSIAATVTEYAVNPFGKFIVFLDNGQVWRQLDGDTGTPMFLRGVGANKVTIERGFLESYNLRLNGQGPIFKVKRVK